MGITTIYLPIWIISPPPPLRTVINGDIKAKVYGVDDAISSSLKLILTRYIHSLSPLFVTP